MKTIIAGGRDYQLTEADFQWLDVQGITEVVCGGCSGADTGGFDWAWSRRIPVKTIVADWKAHGKAAGPIRNAEMARYAERCILFPGGRGTASMRREAMKAGIPVVEAPVGRAVDSGEPVSQIRGVGRGLRPPQV